MTKHPRLIVALGLALVISACASGETGPADDPTTTTTTATTTTTTTPPPPTEEPIDSVAVEDYLVQMTNLDGDLGDQQMEFERQANDQPEPTTEEEPVEGFRDFLVGTFELNLGYIDAVAALQPPASFATAHDAYVVAYRGLFEKTRDDVSGFTTMDEFDAFMAAIFDPAIPPSVEMDQLNSSYINACKNLEQVGRDAGFDFGLGCPEEPPAAVAVDVQVGGPWQANPNPIGVTGAYVVLTLTNVGDEPIQPVVIDIFEGDPTNLPVIDGVVDLTRSGISSDAESDFTLFGLIYPDVSGDQGDSIVSNPPPILAPGESVELDGFDGSGGGLIVIFDYRQDEFQAGSFVVIEQ